MHVFSWEMYGILASCGCCNKLLAKITEIYYFTALKAKSQGVFRATLPGKALGVQSLTCVWLCDPMNCSMPGLPVLTISLSLLKLTCIESVMPSNHLILCGPISFCPPSFPASGSFPVSELFESGGQSFGVSASASVLPMNIQGWVPLGLTGLILLSKGLSRVFSNTTVWKHQFFTAQPSLWSNSHLHTWLLEKPQLWLYGPL